CARWDLAAATLDYW
nr:immunoglobulin heavy chain junction region [Macaca mulatta]